MINIIHDTDIVTLHSNFSLWSASINSLYRFVLETIAITGAELKDKVSIIMQ